MTNEILSFLEASERLGRNPSLVQAAGGNTSLKTNGTFYIKASGAMLKDISQKDIFLKAKFSSLLSFISNNNDLADFDWMGPPELRPSIETLLHTALPQRVVFHLHCINTISWAVCDGVESDVDGRLEGLPFVWVPYKKPGVELASEMSLCIERSCPVPQIYLLKNHGLIVAADSTPEAVNLVKCVSDRLSRPMLAAKLPDINLLARLSSGTDYIPAPDLEHHQLALSQFSVKIASSGSLYPDHVVFLGPSALVADNKEQVFEYDLEQRNSEIKRIIIVPGAGVLVHKSSSTAALEMLSALNAVILRMPSGTKVKYLSPQDEFDIINWDAEKYRQKICKK